VGGTTITVDINDLPLELNAEVIHGDAYRKLWTLQRQSSAGTAAVSLTNVTWALMVYDQPSGGTVKLSKTATAVWTASGIYVDSAANGQFTVYLLSTDVQGLCAGNYYYEVTATFPAGHADLPSMIKTLLKGQLTIVAGIA
jgi:hypothetical protein